MSPETLAEACELLLGPEWKRPTAKLLGPHHPDGARESLDPRLPFRWASGERAVPDWVPPVLSHLLSERAETLAADAKRARALCRLLKRK
ncbi:hypothetical protein ASG63_16670 [Methylobacterium sp. Leaf94]|nr:hypothetical protein ASG63_16670 [Methylobacterium sp. Leaf94]